MFNDDTRVNPIREWRWVRRAFLPTMFVATLMVTKGVSLAGQQPGLLLYTAALLPVTLGLLFVDVFRRRAERYAESLMVKVLSHVASDLEKITGGAVRITFLTLAGDESFRVLASYFDGTGVRPRSTFITRSGIAAMALRNNQIVMFTSPPDELLKEEPLSGVYEDYHPKFVSAFPVYFENETVGVISVDAQRDVDSSVLERIRKVVSGQMPFVALAHELTQARL
jgi:transcriptional regulator with GAF, ATPase, and Fis domain